MRSLIGVDLNGVNDRLGTFEEDGKEKCINLGVRGSMIRLEGQKDRWLAGMQNEFAPHGRGPGWGANRLRRKSSRDAEDAGGYP